MILRLRPTMQGTMPVPERHFRNLMKDLETWGRPRLLASCVKEGMGLDIVDKQSDCNSCEKWKGRLPGSLPVFRHFYTHNGVSLGGI
jgi:hypothetical protein